MSNSIDGSPNSAVPFVGRYEGTYSLPTSDRVRSLGRLHWEENYDTPRRKSGDALGSVHGSIQPARRLESHRTIGRQCQLLGTDPTRADQRPGSREQAPAGRLEGLPRLEP